MTMRYVSCDSNGVATFDDVMQLLARLPYRTMVELADALDADADKMADAANNHITGKIES